MLTLGDADAVEQLRSALAVGATAATLVQAEPSTFGPADVAREIAAVVRGARGRGPRATTWCCSATTPPTAATSRSGSGSPTSSAARSSTAPRWSSVADGTVTARVEGPDGVETYRVPLPAVVTIREGGVEPRYPSVPGPDEGQEGAGRGAHARRRAHRPEAGEADAAPAGAVATCRSSARARPPRPPSSTSSRSWGCWPDDPDPGREDARRRGRRGVAGGADLRPQAVRRGRRRPRRRGRRRRGRRRPAQGRSRRTASAPCYDVGGDGVAAYSGAGWASAILSVREQAKSVVVMAAGTDRGNELMAHVGRPGRRGDGRERAVLRRAVAVRGHPPGRRRRGAGGDACSTSGRRSSPSPVTRSRPTPAETPGRGRRRRGHARDRGRRPGRPRGLDRAARGRRVRRR